MRAEGLIPNDPDAGCVAGDEEKRGTGIDEAEDVVDAARVVVGIRVARFATDEDAVGVREEPGVIHGGRDGCKGLGVQTRKTNEFR